MTNEQVSENLDSPQENEESLLNDNSDNYVSENETDDATEEQEGILDDSTGDSDGDSEESQEDLEKRIQELEGKLKAQSIKKRISKRKDKESVSKDDTSEELTIARLEARGILDKDEQKKVLNLAKDMGKHPIEALSDEYMQFKLKQYRDGKVNAEAVPSSSKKGKPSARGVDWYIQRDELPKDPDLLAEVQDEMAKRARSGA